MSLFWLKRFRFALILLFAMAAFSTPTFATILIPQNLSKNDRIQIVQVIGLGSSSKILSNPYPLGGYTGLEAGFSLESIPSQDIGKLGNGISQAQQTVTIPKLTIGKGVYNNIDAFLQIAPYTSSDELSEYGGMLRWGFYQSQSLPLSASALVHMSSANVSNVLATHAYGLDFIGGANVDNVSVFAGVGYLEATGTFLGGMSKITDSGNEETEFAAGLHTLVGAEVKFAGITLAGQIDRYTVPVISAKLGYRF